MAAIDERLPPARPLPVYVEPSPPVASAAQLAWLDGRIGELLAPSEAARLAALERLDADADALPALAERFEQLAGGSTRAGVELLLGEIRARSREPGSARRGRAAAERRDTLELVVRYPDRSSGYLRPLTELLAYARLFEAIGTLPAVRRVIAGYERFGELMRDDTERALDRLGDRALAALIETTAHPHLGGWAHRRLEALGKHVASEAMQVPDPALRADILRAYGKVRDAGTARLLIAFAASERAQIRLAARQAVALLGEVGARPLRDAFEIATGQNAPPEWPWRRVAEELFARFDGQRLSEVYGLFAEGRAAEARGDLEAARAAYDQVLARDPLFERGALMVPVYLAYAERAAQSAPLEAELAARRAERLAPPGPLRDRALSARHTLEVAALLTRGIVDDALLARARALDPDNARAAALEAELLARTGAARATFRRYAAAVAILALALSALLVTALRLRRERALDARASPSRK